MLRHFRFVLVVGTNDALHQLMAHHIGVVEIRKGQALDILEDIRGFQQTAAPRIGQINLGDVAGDHRYLEKNVIEIAPIAFMRGRTLNDSFVILDEAQNTTSEQMKMFVTRLGFNSKAVITGDVTQIDLPNARRSGLLEAADVLKNVEGLTFAYFDDTDVVRHQLVQRIIRAYDEHKAKVAEQLPLLDSRTNGKANGTETAPQEKNILPSSEVETNE